MKTKNNSPNLNKTSVLTELLYGAVCAPRQLERDVHAPPLVDGASVALQRDTARGSLADDGYVFLAVHEPLLLRQVQRLQRHVYFGPGLILDPVLGLHNAAFATRHLHNAQPSLVNSVHIFIHVNIFK